MCAGLWRRGGQRRGARVGCEDGGIGTGRGPRQVLCRRRCWQGAVSTRGICPGAGVLQAGHGVAHHRQRGCTTLASSHAGHLEEPHVCRSRAWILLPRGAGGAARRQPPGRPILLGLLPSEGRHRPGRLGLLSADLPVKDPAGILLRLRLLALLLLEVVPLELLLLQQAVGGEARDLSPHFCTRAIKRTTRDLTVHARNRFGHLPLPAERCLKKGHIISIVFHKAAVHINEGVLDLEAQREIRSAASILPHGKCLLPTAIHLTRKMHLS
mmetsp:Transcript_149842/g.417488  ORF Transcript_149842/g.417488 Transcript_149842/m.417488 type:complete len:269 (+) Transcript_149842:1024-1830(+)